VTLPGKRARMIIHERRPLNAQTPRYALLEGLLTGTDAFYVRNHGPIPELDASARRLGVGGLVGRCVSGRRAGRGRPAGGGRLRRAHRCRCLRGGLSASALRRLDLPAQGDGRQVLLAWAMNGRPVPAVHGAPLRAVVPGYIGARRSLRLRVRW
jgi:sulfite oxidase